MDNSDFDIVMEEVEYLEMEKQDIEKRKKELLERIGWSE